MKQCLRNYVNCFLSNFSHLSFSSNYYYYYYVAILIIYLFIFQCCSVRYLYTTPQTNIDSDVIAIDSVHVY